MSTTVTQTQRQAVAAFQAPLLGPFPFPPPLTLRDQTVRLLEAVELGDLQEALNEEIEQIQTAEEAAVPEILANLFVRLLPLAVDQEEADNLINLLESVLQEHVPNYQELLDQATARLIDDETAVKVATAQFVVPEAIEGPVRQWIGEFQALDLQGLETNRAAIALGILYCRIVRPHLPSSLPERPTLNELTDLSQTATLLKQIRKVLRGILPSHVSVKNWLESCVSYSDQENLLAGQLALQVASQEQIEATHQAAAAEAAATHLANEQRITTQLRQLLEEAKQTASTLQQRTAHLQRAVAAGEARLAALESRDDQLLACIKQDDQRTAAQVSRVKTIVGKIKK